MSFLVKQQSLPASDSETQRVSSYTEADPVGFGLGKDVWAPHWLSQAFNRRTAPSGANMPDWQYASIAAGYRMGPIKYVGRVWINKKPLAFFDYTFADGEDSHTFVLNPSLKLGDSWRLTLYRGTGTQGTSWALVNGTGQNHPPYRDLVWGLWENIDLGQGVSSIPTLELELLEEAPAVGAHPGGATIMGVNPFNAVYRLFTDDRLGDVDTSLLNPADWGQRALDLETTGVFDRKGDWTYMHPSVSGAKSIAQLASEWLAYVNGTLAASDGKIVPVWEPGLPPSPETLTEISEHDLDADEKPPSGVLGDWNAGLCDATVIYRRSWSNYEEFPAKHPAPANRETGVGATTKRFERPGIHEEGQANMMATELSAGSGESDSTKSLAILHSRAVKPDGTPLMPGDYFNWDYEPHKLDMVVRVVSRRFRPDKASDLLTITRAQGAWPRPYVPAVDERVPASVEPPGEFASDAVRLWMLPSGFGLVRQVTALVDRNKTIVTGWRLHLAPTAAGPWAPILNSSFFAAKVTLTAAATAEGGTISLASSSLDMTRMQAQGKVDQADDRLCLLIGDELLSVGDLIAVAQGTLSASVLRARRGTTAAAHAAGTVGWLFLREELVSSTHGEYTDVRVNGVYDVTKATKYHRLSAYTGAGAEGAPKPDAGIPFTLPDYSPLQAAIDVVLSTYSIAVACDAAGTVLAGQLGATGKAKTTVTAVKNGIALEAVSGTPNESQFSVNIDATSATTATIETPDTVRVDSITADLGSVTIAVNVAGLITLKKVFAVTKVKSGSSGLTPVTIYRRAVARPDTPEGDSPSGWYSSIPEGDYAVWQSTGYMDTAGHIVGSWSVPTRASGIVTTVSATAPANPWKGDFWVDVSEPLNPKVKVWNEYAWELTGPDAFEVVNGVLRAKQAVIGAVAAGAIQAGDVAALYLAVASRIRHPSYVGRYFSSQEYAGGFDTSKSWAAASAWGFAHSTPAMYYGPGYSSGATPRFCPNPESGSCLFDAQGLILGHTGLITLYYRVNDGACVPLIASASDDAGNARLRVARRIYGLSPTDKIAFYVAPCDDSGNIAAAVGDKWTNTEVVAHNWA